MRLSRAPLLFALYPLLPHRALGRLVRAWAEARRPRWVVDAWTGEWLRRADVDLEGTERGPFASVAEAFGRRLVPGGRALGAGLVSPVDGEVVATGTIVPGLRITVKGREMSLARVAGGVPLDPWLGGTYAVIFLSPRGYHHVHAPAPMTVDEVVWVPGRFYPQNHDALRAIPRVYERNERAVLRATTRDGAPLLLVMVAASLVGGVEVHGSLLAGGARPRSFDVEKGERLGSFLLGSTVVLLVPKSLGREVSVLEGDALRMGQSLRS